MAKVNARVLYHGNNQYFQGHAERENEKLISTSFGPRTTAHELVDGLVDDFNSGCEYPEAFDDITDDDVKKVLVETIDGDTMQAILKYVEVKKTRCPDCDGAGEVQSDDGDEAVDCKSCDGTGELEDEYADYDLQTIVLLSVDEEG